MENKIKWIVFSFILLGFGFCRPLSAEVVDRIVAIVDNDIVTLVQLNKETAPYIKNIETSAYPAEKKKEMLQNLNKKILDALIDNSLTQQEAKKYQIEVSDTEIQNAVENVKKNKSLTQEQLEKALENEGITLKEYHETIKKQILQGRIINQAVKSKVVITDADIKTYYETHEKEYSGIKKYRLRNILMQDENQMAQVKQKLDEKADFSLLAQQYSVSPNAKDGGNLGTFDIHNFSENIKESIVRLKPGEHTDVILTPQGFQIFYLEDIVIEDSKPYEKIRDEIQEKLYREQVEKKFQTWLESLKKKAHIKIML